MSNNNQTNEKNNRAIIIENNQVDSKALLSDKKELVITHNLEIYRLRLTANQKLILTK